MERHTFGRLVHAVITVTIAASSPAPAFAAKSSEGMEVKLVSARKYHGKNAKYVKPAKVAKAVPKKPMVLTSAKVNAPTPAEMQNRVVVVKATGSKSVEKMKPITASHTPTVSKAKAQAIATATTTKTQRPAPNRDTVSGTTRPAKTVVVAEDDITASLAPEKDLTDSLDRLPIEESPAAAKTTSLSTRIAMPTSQEEKPMFSPVLQFRNRLTTGRKYELEEIGGKNFGRKHEVYLGAKHRSGFGAALTGSVSATSFADTQKDTQTTGDVTTVLYQPTWYKGGGWDFPGMARVFFPTSDASKTTNKMKYYYYFGSNYTFSDSFAIENSIGLLYITQNKFADDDVYFIFEEELYAKYKMLGWLTFGFGPYLQSYSKERSRPGTSIELAPHIGMEIGSNIYFESKAYLPVFVDGDVGNPRRAAIDEIGGEFYLKMWL